VFPLDHVLDHVGVSLSVSRKLINREIIFELFQPMWSLSTNVTDGETDDMLSLCALRYSASRGKNMLLFTYSLFTSSAEAWSQWAWSSENCKLNAKNVVLTCQ